MSLPRYPEYKDSGVHWLGDMPNHWLVRRYKQVFVEREERSETGQETLLSVSAYTGVSPRSEIVDDGDYLSRAESLEGYKVCYPNDLVMNIMLAWNRGLGFSAFHGIVSPAYSVFEPLTGNSPRFLDYMVRSDQVTLYYKAFSSGVIDSRLRLYPDTFGSLYCVLPPQEEQTTIATFLDRETGKIDALIAEQEKLLTLLAEKRQATISQAVTKGLNPDVPMKDSGVAWLGDIPEHWDVVPIKRLVEVKDGTHATPNYVTPAEDTFPLVTSKDFGSASICFEDAKHISSKDHAEIIRRSNTENGDVLMSMIGGNIGKALIVETEREFSIKNVALFKTSQAPCLAQFLLFYLQSGLLDIQVDLLSRGGAQGFLGLGDIRNLVFFKMSSEEMRSIVQKLDERLAPLNQLFEASKHSLNLLKERRSALIAAAVTGQIDVRGLVTEPEAA